jgi:hypothetical protein
MKRLQEKGGWMIPDHHATKGRSEVGKDEMRKRRRCRSVLLFY